jgi:hypothetical protein
MPRKTPEQLQARAGQAVVEYLVIATGVLIALGALSVGGEMYCLNGMGGKLSRDACENLPAVFHGVMQKTVQDVTFLINLPF